MPTRQDILQTAIALTTGDRCKTHGDAVTQHEFTARLWSAYAGHPFTAEDVAWMMNLVKMSRAKSGAFNPDDYVDGAGYVAIAGECRTHQPDFPIQNPREIIPPPDKEIRQCAPSS